MEEVTSAADGSHPPCAFYRNRENRKICREYVINYGRTISTCMKNVSQHATKCKTVFADNVLVFRIKRNGTYIVLRYEY